jgi:FkbM family methyltransferase
VSKAHLARVNDWLYVGDCESCGDFPGPNVVHIFRTDVSDRQDALCRHDGRRNLRMNYRDGDELDASNLRNLEAFFGQVGPLPEATLVHCFAGMCRSPTVAVLALVFADNLHPIDAQQMVTRAVYEQTGKVCNVTHNLLRQMLAIYEKRQVTLAGPATYDTGECVLHVHDDFGKRANDIGVCHEVHNKDCYRVRQLAGEGFRPRVIIDVGAHIGTFTTLAGKYFPAATIHSFEPDPDNYPLLVKNAPPNCVTHHCAVVGLVGDADAHRPAHNHFERRARSGEIAVVSATDMLALADGPVFLKLDCEESEVNILRELAGSLAGVEVIAGEWHFSTARRDVQDILGKTHEVDLIDKGQWNLFFARRRKG